MPKKSVSNAAAAGEDTSETELTTKSRFPKKTSTQDFADSALAVGSKLRPKIKRVKEDLTNITIQTMFKNPAIMMINERVTFVKLLFRWQNSIWQSLKWDLLVFIIAFYAIRITLIYGVGSKDPFEPAANVTGSNAFVRGIYKKVADLTKSIANLMPLTFLLGFFVSTVLARWWAFSSNFPSLSSAALIIQANIRSRNPNLLDTTWHLKQAFARYLNLAFLFAMRNYSYEVQKRFEPKETSQKKKFIARMRKTVRGKKEKNETEFKKKVRTVLESINCDPEVQKTYGQLITEEEIVYFEEIEASSPTQANVLEAWIPLRWCTELVAKAQELKCLYDEQSYRILIEAVNSFRGSLGTISSVCKFNIPLVYIQAIIIVVYAFMISELLDDQIITDVEHPLVATFGNMFPFVSLVRFFLFMGWFKIGLSLINPLREDQSHFPTLEMVDYNLRFMSRFTLTKCTILPPSMQLHGEELKQALKHDANEILSTTLKEAISETIRFKAAGSPEKDKLTTPPGVENV